MRIPPPGVAGRLLNAYVTPVDVAGTARVPVVLDPIAWLTFMPNPTPLQTNGAAVLAAPVMPATHTAVLSIQKVAGDVHGLIPVVVSDEKMNA
jgi:hypothetical protein